MIYALASLFSFPNELGEDTAWAKIERVFSLAQVAITPMPHFSWHVAETYDFNALDHKLNLFVRSLEPFNLHVAGTGIFNGEKPVIYLPVTKTQRVTAIHNEISNWIQEFTNTMNPNYAPDIWIPHITLSDNGLTPESICQVFKDLAYIPMNEYFPIDHFAIIYRDGNASGVRRKFNFGVGAQ